jgi:hypothetical protein
MPLLILPRGAEATRLLADVLAERSVSLCNDCTVGIVSTKTVVCRRGGDPRRSS